MADTLTIDGIHAAITEQLAAEFPTFQTVGDYERQKGHIKVPAAFLNLESFEPCDDGDGEDGTERLVVNLRWELRVLLGPPGASNERAARGLAVNLAKWVQGNRFGLSIHPAKFLRGESDKFTPELDHYTPWLIEFEQCAHLGESVWDDDSAIPTTIFVGYEPNTGTDHVDDYVQVSSEDELPDL